MLISLRASLSPSSEHHAGREARKSRGKAALVSLRFKPAFVSHLSAFGKACQELGLDVEFVIDPAYKRFPELKGIAAVTSYGEAQFKDSYTHALFMNVSPQNRKLASRLKNTGARILYLYHEPWYSFVEFFKGEGIRSGLKGVLAHHLSVQMLRLADAVILPSRYGAEVYARGDSRYNQNAFYVPLLFDDETRGTLREEPGRRQYFSYIGTICRAHGFDQYVAFMRKSLNRKSGLRFLIASRLPLPSYVLRDDIICRNLDHVEVRCGRPLHNEEINHCYAESLCVWNLYRRSTQSGALTKALMFGAPVLACQRGSFPEFIKDGFNGRFASADDVEGIDAVVENIRNDIIKYTANCRKTFLETFFYRANLRELEQLLVK